MKKSLIHFDEGAEDKDGVDSTGASDNGGSDEMVNTDDSGKPNSSDVNVGANIFIKVIVVAFVVVMIAVIVVGVMSFNSDKGTVIGHSESSKVTQDTNSTQTELQSKEPIDIYVTNYFVGKLDSVTGSELHVVGMPKVRWDINDLTIKTNSGMDYQQYKDKTVLIGYSLDPTTNEPILQNVTEVSKIVRGSVISTGVGDKNTIEVYTNKGETQNLEVDVDCRYVNATSLTQQFEYYFALGSDNKVYAIIGNLE